MMSCIIAYVMHTMCIHNARLIHGLLEFINKELFRAGSDKASTSYVSSLIGIPPAAAAGVTSSYPKHGESRTGKKNQASGSGVNSIREEFSGIYIM